MHIVGDPGLRIMSLAPRKNRRNRDGHEDAAIDLLKANPKLSVREMSRVLKDAGIRRGKDWVQEKRYELIQENGGKLSGDASKVLD
jgi:hypothetical protein